MEIEAWLDKTRSLRILQKLIEWRIKLQSPIIFYLILKKKIVPIFWDKSINWKTEMEMEMSQDFARHYRKTS